MFSKTIVRLPLAAALAAFAASAHADVFNMPGGQTSLSLVRVGDPGNKADPSTGLGAVSRTYYMGKYDVTVGQYCQFLNSVAATSDPYELCKAGMATYYPTVGIARSGSSGCYSYSVTGCYSQGVNCPMFFVSWGSAARFCNWLQNGQPCGAGTVEVPGTTETGAYALNGKTAGTSLMAVTRNKGAQYFIPTEDEFYKAAFYMGGGTASGYWTYPTRSNTEPSNVLSATGTNNANFVGHGSTDPTNKLTPVGYFILSPSPYGTYDQGGDIFQWTETQTFATLFCRDLRGGAWNDFARTLSTGVGIHPCAGDLRFGGDINGFRVAASDPTPWMAFQGGRAVAQPRLHAATDPPDISGDWFGDDWGRVILKKADDRQYTGGYSNTVGKEPGEIRLKWSRIERRFSGTWREGDDRFGVISVRLVGDAMRGALATDAKSKNNPATPRLADLTWTRAKAALGEGQAGKFGDHGQPAHHRKRRANAVGFTGDDLSAVISAPDSRSLDATRAITLSAWIYETSHGRIRHIARKEGQYTLWVGSHPHRHNGGRNLLGFHLWGLVGKPDDFLSKQPIMLNQWHHVAATYDGSQVALYIDGRLDGAFAASGLIAATGNLLCIGLEQEPGQESQWAGSIAELTIFNRALSATEIGAIYDGGEGMSGTTTQTPWKSGLAAGYHFDEGKGPIAHDFSGHGNDATLRGNVAWVAGEAINSRPPDVPRGEWDPGWTVRLRTAKTTWAVDELPEFMIDLRKREEAEPDAVRQSLDNWLLEVDGRRFRLGVVDIPAGEHKQVFEPGTTREDFIAFHFYRDEKTAWRVRTGKRVEWIDSFTLDPVGKDGQVLSHPKPEDRFQWTPGKHVVRIIFPTPHEGSQRHLIVSNSVEVQIGGKPSAGQQCLSRPKARRDFCK